MGLINNDIFKILENKSIYMELINIVSFKIWENIGKYFRILKETETFS